MALGLLLHIFCMGLCLLLGHLLSTSQADLALLSWVNFQSTVGWLAAISESSGPDPEGSPARA